MLEDIEIFCAIAKHQSFAKAARALRISTSIATRRLSKLEAQLGIRLLHRTTRQVTLTEAGKLYYEQVQDILETLEMANKNVKSLSNDIGGILKIGV
ncbi:MAG: LysR family transcriptional regulator, partial [Gammaproteobacteria bacterium]|nr:LysR family transcriptional regulator [Gammaproteobacteria bacterium]